MRKLLLSGIILLFLGLPGVVRAYTITRDPQYIVFNLSKVNDLDWAAPEAVWQKDTKPQVQRAIREIKQRLPAGSAERKLAWSTLLEYMNFPLDTPSEASPYVIKIRRILELAEEEQLPVFIPLNGFQWWDELPELYNWWDPDGTHTQASFFARQKTKDFKQRFIRGYNPENKWNVEWQNYTTPMQLNWRNWGGGGFQLAPPPNILKHTRTANTYRSVLDGRFTAIVTELSKTLTRWQDTGKEDLFAGISLGTEVSLNASVTRSDEFIPYGYRAIQELLCPADDPTCGIKNSWNNETIRFARQDALQSYLFDMSLIAHKIGLPKQRVYTHVYADMYVGNPRFEKYADAAFTPFARPGISLYGSATNPLGLKQWSEALKEQAYPAWGTLEYAAGTSYGSWASGLQNTLNNPVDSAKIMDVYNWDEYRTTAAVEAIAAFLKTNPQPSSCMLPEILPITRDSTQNPSNLEWRYIPDSAAANISTLKLHVTSVLSSFSLPVQEKISPVSPDQRRISTASIPYGTHAWYIEAEGCNGAKKQFSEPQTVIMSATFGNISPVNWFVRFLKRLH